jgi:Asp-tRNA(Asn)/Glu-tRNA(Gln) amidotransferase A subunit family amidase
VVSGQWPAKTHLCRSVTDCALVLKAIYGPDGHDPTVAAAPFGWNPATPISSLRVGYVKAEFDAIQDEEPRKIFSDALNVLKGQEAKNQGERFYVPALQSRSFASCWHNGFNSGSGAGPA